MMARGVTDGPKLAARLLGGLQTCLRGGELEAQFQHRIVVEGPFIQWVPIPGRSVLVSINDLVITAKFGLVTGTKGPKSYRAGSHDPP
jgi:hypothetical protein